MQEFARQSNKVSVVQQGMHPLTPLLPYDHFNPSPPHIPTDVSQKPGVHRHQSQEISGFYSLPQGQITPSMNCKSHAEMKREKEPKKPVIKKPLNAFMLYMKEMRAKVIAECTLKESAAINQILGRRGKKKRRKRDKQQDSGT
ncbi:hypothetical protein cypCar_00031974, partial [Cyprinus carpio]